MLSAGHLPPSPLAPPPSTTAAGAAGAVLATMLRSRVVSALALAVVITALVLPPQGFGVPTCQFLEWTKLPCFGCGLTRSFVGMAHLNLARAAFFHPCGVPLFLLCLGLAGFVPVSRARRERCARWVEERARPVTYLAVAFLCVFILYGFGRMAWVAMLLKAGLPSPW